MSVLPPAVQRLFLDRPTQAPVEFLRERIGKPPRIALVLGSGLGDFAQKLLRPRTFAAGDIPDYPRSTVPGHRGEIVAGDLAGRRILAFRGRIHLYECNDLATVLFPVAVAAELGARVLVVTNAAGGINRRYLPGDLMLITDQIDLTLHPEGLPLERPGPAGSPFDAALTEHAWRVASSRGLPVRRGVYAAVKGPSYETAAEVEMLYRLGGDAVGMSTVKEVALARVLGMHVLGISCITNRATGTGPERLDHGEVTTVAGRVQATFAELLTECIAGMPVPAEGKSL